MLLDELRARLAFLVDVGLGYLDARPSEPHAVGRRGPAHQPDDRARHLAGHTLFVLDEPSIGLHPRDMHRVIEGDAPAARCRQFTGRRRTRPQVMLAADRVLDMGPGPGERGGRIVFNGTPDELRRAETLTGRYLRRTAVRRRHAPAAGGAERAQGRAAGRARTQPEGDRPRDSVEAARLRDRRLRQRQVDADPGRAVPALAKAKGRSTETRAPSIACSATTGSTTSRSSTSRRSARRRAPTRQATSERSTRSARSSRSRACEGAATTTAGTFSFNSGDGRCPTCGGNGFEHVEMQFLSDVLPALPGLRRQALPPGDARGRGGSPGQARQHRRRGWT